MSRKGKIIIYVSIAILIVLIGIVIGYFCVKNLKDNENSNPVESPVEKDEEIEINDPIESMMKAYQLIMMTLEMNC